MIVKKMVRNLLVGCLLSSLFAAASLGAVHARPIILQQADTAWSTPSNLSQSGGASSPRLVVDSDGRVNLLWLDKYAGAFGEPGLVGAQGVEGQWSSPTRLDLPFGRYLEGLKLAAAPNGWIYAAWIDDQGSLYTSQVRGGSFAQPGSWTVPQLLAFSVADFDLATASDGNVHYIFARAEDSSDFPAGVYTLRTIGTGTMTTPRLLDASPYFRGLTADEVEVSLAAGDGNVFAAWELPTQEQVFTSVSNDDGDSWSEARLVDKRQAGDGDGVGPSQPRLRALEGAQAGTAMLVWQAGHQGVNCAQYTQYTEDSGQTWSEAARLPEPFDKSCAQQVQLMAIPEGGILAFTETASAVNLLAWDPAASQGGWSNAQAQNEVSGFTNPVTYRAASLGCRQAGLSPEGRLFVAGCESAAATAEGAHGDIWLFERGLGELADWYPPPAAEPLWSLPLVLDSEQEGFTPPILVGDPNGRLHALWARQNDSGLYYAQWDGSRWTQAQAVLNSPGGAPQGLSALVHPDGQLVAAWSDPAAGSQGGGGLFYSQVPAKQASESDAWLAPQDLPLDGTPSAPQVVALPDGRLALAYAQAYNEGRGIYLVESKAAPQAGQLIDWADPQVIFGADEAGWDSVGDPHLALAGDGSLEALWIRYGLPPESRSVGLYSARGQAGADGYTWSQVEEVRQGQVAWSQVMAVGDELHRAWQELVGAQPVLFHQVSTDSGRTWSTPARLGGATGSGQQIGQAGMALTPNGEVNLVQINSNGPKLQRWGWQAEPGGAGGTRSWKELETEEMTGVKETFSLSLAGGVQGLGLLFVGVEAPSNSVLGETGTSQEAESAPIPYHLYYSERELEGGQIPGSVPTAAATAPAGGNPGPNQQEELTPTPGPTEQPRPTPTATFNPNPASTPLAGLGGMSGSVFIGLAAALVLASLAFLVVGRNRRK